MTLPREYSSPLTKRGSMPKLDINVVSKTYRVHNPVLSIKATSKNINTTAGD